MPLAQSRSVRIGGTTVARTPLLLPSYSSRALDRGPVRADSAAALADTVARTMEIVVGPILISAYDLHNGAFDAATTRDGRPVFDSPLTFIDSGGYETLEEPDPAWTREAHAEALEKWHADAQAVAVGFDTPDPDVGAQIATALALLPDRRVGRELLLKPVPGAALSERGGMLDLIDQLRGHAAELKGLDVVGLTEKEAGSSLRQRLLTVAALRRALDRQGSPLPIHYFGGLDPVLTPLFFLAGADVFDGLSWLRYAFADGQAHYIQPAASLAFPDTDVKEAAWLIRRRNFFEVNRLQTGMQRFLVSGEPEHLHPSGRHLVSLAEQWGVRD